MLLDSKALCYNITQKFGDKNRIFDTDKPLPPGHGYSVHVFTVSHICAEGDLSQLYFHTLYTTLRYNLYNVYIYQPTFLVSLNYEIKTLTFDQINVHT